MTLDDAAKVLGIIGGLTGPLGLVIAWLTYRRDAGRLRINLTRGRITQGPDDDRVRTLLARYTAAGEDPPMDLFTRDPDKSWAIIEVTNVGRRKVRLEKIGWRKRRKFMIPAGFFGYPGSAPWLPCDLEEGQRRDFPVEDSRLAHADYVYATMSTGRHAYGAFPPGWRGFRFRAMTAFESLRRWRP